MTASELVRLLKSRGIRPRRSLGQHFLASTPHLDRIVQLAELDALDAVLEVGAGTGLLTVRLAERAGTVAAVELDPKLADLLEEVVGRHPRVRIVRGDAMKLDLAGLFPPGMRRKVVANLPYGIASALLVRLLQEVPDLARLVVTVQEEVGRRLVARPGTPEYGLLTVLVRFHADVQLAFRIAPRAFVPPPQVTSAVVVLTARPRPAGVNEEAFRSLVRAAFAQRRKQLRRSWTHVAPAALLEKAAQRAAVDLRRRGETLTVEEFVAVARALVEYGGWSAFHGANAGRPDKARSRLA